MPGRWTFSQRVGASFAGLVALAVVLGVVAFVALRAVVSTKDRVIDVDAQLLLDSQRVQALAEAKGSDSRGFLLTADERLLGEMQATRSRLIEVLELACEGVELT